MANLEKELNHGIIYLLVMSFFLIIGLVYFYKKKPDNYKIGLAFLSFLFLLSVKYYFEFYVLHNDYIYVEGKVIGITTGSRNSIKSIKYEYIYNSKNYIDKCGFPYYIDEKDLNLDNKYFQVRIGTNFPSISEMDFYKPISK